MTVTRFDALAAPTDIFSLQTAYLDEVLLAVSEGTSTESPVILTIDVKTGLGKLRTFDNSAMVTTAQPLINGDYFIAPDGKSWAVRQLDRSNYALYTQTRSGDQVGAPVKVAVPDVTAVAFLKDGTAVGMYEFEMKAEDVVP